MFFLQLQICNISFVIFGNFWNFIGNFFLTFIKLFLNFFHFIWFRTLWYLKLLFLFSDFFVQFFKLNCNLVDIFFWLSILGFNLFILLRQFCIRFYFGGQVRNLSIIFRWKVFYILRRWLNFEHHDHLLNNQEYK